jgi:hypothetical protein
MFSIHSVNLFLEKLEAILTAEPFLGRQKSFADKTKIDPGLLNRVLNRKRAATPQLVGRICSVLPAENAKLLLIAFLSDVAAETAAAYPKSQKTDQLKISIQVQVPALSARNTA